MDKYVRVDWPESQEWMDEELFEDWVEDGDIVFGQDSGQLLIWEELYNEVKGE